MSCQFSKRPIRQPKPGHSPFWTITVRSAELPLSKDGPILFVGSGPNRVSQEIRGNVFAHSCLAYLRENALPFVIMDTDAAGPLARDGALEVVREPFDAQGVAAALERVRPSRVWPACAGKEVQALFLQALGEKGHADAILGGAGAYRAGTDWTAFRDLATSVGVQVPFGKVVTSVEQAAQVAAEVGFPLFLSASRSTGGGGARIIYNFEELSAAVAALLTWSLAYEVLAVRVHEKNAQCEVHILRDSSGDVRVLGISDTLAPLGVHVANTTNVFPARGLSDTQEKQAKAAATAIVEKAGLVGYAACHFGLGTDGAYAVGMRVGFSASSYILATGTGLDIARAATAVALGASAGEAVKGAAKKPLVAISIPRFENRLFPGAGEAVGPFKVSTGAGIGIGQEFGAAFLNAASSARPGRGGLFESALETARHEPNLMALLAAPHVDLIADLAAAIIKGHDIDEIATVSGINGKYLEEMAALASAWQEAECAGVEPGDAEKPADGKKRRFSSKEVVKHGDKAGKAIAIFGPVARGVGEVDEADVFLRGVAREYLKRGYRLIFGGWQSQMPLDLFFAASEVHLNPSVETAEAILKSKGVEYAYVDPRNSSPEAISRLAVAMGVTLVGVEPDRAAVVYDRKALSNILTRVGLTQKEGEEVGDVEQAKRAAARYGYPILLKDRRGEPRTIVAYDEEHLAAFVSRAKGVVVAERFLEDLVESAVVVLSDGVRARTVSVIEVLDEPAISCLDRAGVLPPFSITERLGEMLASRAEAFVAALGFKGLVTARLGIRYDVPYFLSAALGGACREAAFTAFATGRDVVKAAAEIFAGASLDEAWPAQTAGDGAVYIRQPVFSFGRFPGTDTVLTTRPRSTGDVIGEGRNFSLAFAAARRSAGRPLTVSGTAFVSLRDRDKRAGMLIGRQLKDLGFKVVATEGTARAFAGTGVDARVVYRVSEGRPNAIDLIKNREITLVIYTQSGTAPREDEVQIRTVAWSLGIPVITTAGEAVAALSAIEALKAK
jgi:carbamoyl-phosphate synthase large subunit